MHPKTFLRAAVAVALFALGVSACSESGDGGDGSDATDQGDASEQLASRFQGNGVTSDGAFEFSIGVDDAGKVLISITPSSPPLTIQGIDGIISPAVPITLTSGTPTVFEVAPTFNGIIDYIAPDGQPTSVQFIADDG